MEAVNYFLGKAKTAFIFLLIWVAGIKSFSQADNLSKKINPDLLKQDFTMLRDSLQILHAGLYRYKSKKEIDLLFDSCYKTLDQPMSEAEFFRLTSFAIGAIEDGHTNCRLPRDMQRDYLNNVKVFPALVMFINNRAFILCSKQNDALAGAELLSINDRPMKEIIQNLFLLIPSDGAIQSRKNWELIENFPLFYNLVYGEKESFVITVKTKSGDTKSVNLNADLIKNIYCVNPPGRPKKYLQLNYTPGNVAVLTIKSFFNGFLSQTNENFKSFLDSAFKDLKDKKVTKLIIDVRGNQGGNDDNGILLYQYIASEPFRYYESQETNKEKFSESGHENLGIKFPAQNNFNGKVFFLIDGRSFSASAEFAAVAKSNDRGLFIGEETGGGYYGNTSGDDITITLPNSQITARIPMVKYTSAVKKMQFSDRGVIPDYISYPDVDYFSQHSDVQLEYALKIANGK
ncbi:MAG TPA: S41 family peptidase [Puia sp.]|jgi:hypothetical protein|nr:S41 family peptidase [Puia sp.]